MHKFMRAVGLAGLQGRGALEKLLEYCVQHADEREYIKNEEKTHPLSDEELTELLHKKGFRLSRRTVSKYREKLNIPVQRLRKEIRK